MKLSEVMNNLNLRLLTEPKDFSQIQITSGYSSDLLSCVMAGAAKQDVWVTLQSHNNIVAVAALLELSAIIITEGAVPDENTIAKANAEEVVLLSTSEKTFHVIGKLWELGIH
jgi:hypothetical protein